MPKSLSKMGNGGKRIHPEDAAGFYAQAATFLQQGFFTNEYRFRHHNGTYRWLRDEHRLIQTNGNPLEVIGSLTDITDHKEGELALQAKPTALPYLV